MQKSHNRVSHQISDKIESVRAEIDLRPVGVKDASKALLLACADLPIAATERFILLLLRQRFLPAGSACYHTWGEWNSLDVELAYG
jgi:hypothetical protein